MAKMKVEVTITKDYDKGTIKKDVSEMTRKEIADMARSLFSKLNKRITRLEQAKGVISPALESVNKSGGKFYMKGLNRNQLLKEYSRALTFENSATGTVTGARSYTNRLKSIMGERVQDKEYVARVFDLVHRAQELHPTISNAIGSNEVARIVTEVVDESIDLELATMKDYEGALNKDFDEAIEEISERIYRNFEGLYDGLADGFKM